MQVNRDKPDLWKADIAESVDMYNEWFVRFAPKAFRDSRAKETVKVKAALEYTKNLTGLSSKALQSNPGILSILRMATCPPIARDRLIGLAQVARNTVGCMEKGSMPKKAVDESLQQDLKRIIKTITKMLDVDIFVWLSSGSSRKPTTEEVDRAATIVADRSCGAVADPIIRNAQERRQLDAIAAWLKARGYTQAPGKAIRFREMEPGTFAFRVNVPVKLGEKQVNIPVDSVVMPHGAKAGRLPILIEAKSAGDYTNVNKRRKEEATKINQLRATYGKQTQLNLFLCGYFDSGYLGYEAAEGIDWVWEHRIDDLQALGL